MRLGNSLVWHLVFPILVVLALGIGAFWVAVPEMIADRPEISRLVVFAIFGIGGLGHMAVQYANIAGARVAAVDVSERKLEVAREVGASVLVKATEDDAGAVIAAHGGADAAIVTAATPIAFEQAYRSLKRGGRLVLVGLPAENHFDLPIFVQGVEGILRGNLYSTIRGLHILGDHSSLNLFLVAPIYALFRTPMTLLVVQTVALAPWLMFPGLVVIIAVLAFNLVGDGLRDAADPYGH